MVPSLRTTRWHGTTTGTGLCEQALADGPHGLWGSRPRWRRPRSSGWCRTGSRGRCSRTSRRKPRARRQIDRDVERAAAAGEVLVELAGGVFESARGAQDARADLGGELGEHGVVVLALERDPDEAAVRGGQQQRPERAVDDAVGDVEQALAFVRASLSRSCSRADAVASGSSKPSEARRARAGLGWRVVVM